MQPTEKHRETASEIVKAFGGIINAMPNEATIADFRDAACSVVSEALANAKREGVEAERKRCADIAETADIFIQVHDDGFEAVRRARRRIAAAIRNTSSQAGEA